MAVLRQDGFAVVPRMSFLDVAQQLRHMSPSNSVLPVGLCPDMAIDRPGNSSAL